jgi:cell division septation protein DedD
MESLRLENQRLLDTVAGLEAQLEAQQEALAKPAPPPPKPTTAPAEPKSAPIAGTSAGSEAPGSWFVNFGSYSQRGMADSWAARLKPDTGRAVVTTGSRDGKTFYRVRVIELADRATADRVARQLESEYGLSKLWVGK